MQYIEIYNKEHLDLDFSKFDIVKIRENSYIHLNFSEFIKKEFSEYLVPSQKMIELKQNKNYESAFCCFGYKNTIWYNNDKFSFNRIPLISPFYQDGIFNFPLKKLKKRMKSKKDRDEKDKLFANANAFSFKLFTSIMIEEIKEIGFENVQVNPRSVFVSGMFDISELTLKSVIRKQHSMDEEFPVKLRIWGDQGSCLFKTNWKTAKLIITGLSYTSRATKKT